MIKYQKRTVIIEDDVESVTCDICGITVRTEVEMDEFIYIRHVGGYGNPLGDGQEIQCDICPECLREKLGHYLRDDKGKRIL